MSFCKSNIVKEFLSKNDEAALDKLDNNIHPDKTPFTHGADGTCKYATFGNGIAPTIQLDSPNLPGGNDFKEEQNEYMKHKNS